jgi:hypothetical protein
MKETKFTKREKFNALIAILNGEKSDVPATDLVDFCKGEIDKLDNRKAREQEKAAAKKAESDALEVAVKNLLTDEFATIADITSKIEGIDEVTPHKVAYRLKNLVEAEIAEKKEISVTGADGKKTKKVAYRAL